MSIGWPEGILLALVAIEFATHCEKAGQPRSPYSPVTHLINAAVVLGLLWWGGFFA